jgi:hypothetical protein
MNADDLTENAAGLNDNTVTEFATYEDYLDSQITPTDLYYLEVKFQELRIRIPYI